jgi:hypothetical protein
MLGPVRVEVHDERLYAHGHLVDKFVRKLAAETTGHTRRHAPRNKRTRKFPKAPPIGTLKRLIASTVDRVETRVVGFSTQADAPYAVYVHQGTGRIRGRWAAGTIGPRFTTQDVGPVGGRFRKGGIPLPNNNWGPYRRVSSVKGQPANPFIIKGMADTGKRHEAMRGANIMRRLLTR